MINLRYHIVSITAVFLALGIGVAVGTTFLDRATVDTLNNRLDGLQERIRDTESDNSALSDRVNALEDLENELGEQGGRLLAGALDRVPVVVVAARGIDEAAVDGVIDALASSGATLTSTLWLTDRLALGDDGAQDDLAQALGLSAGDPAQLRRAALTRLANALADRAQAPPPPADGEEVAPPSAIPDPEVLLVLQSSGFIEIDTAPGAPDDGSLLPAAGARYVIVSGPGAELPDGEVFLPFLARLTDRSPVPVVAAQSGAGGEESRTVFVGLIRDDDALRQLVTTVDDLETFAGRAATVLALQDAARGRVGHYGVGDGADSLLPPILEGG